MYFFEIDNRDYLITAAHVLDDRQDHTLYVGQNGLIPINLTFLSTIAPDGKRLRDKIDFAFAPINGSWRDLGVKPIKVSNLVNRDDAPYYSAIGFPNSRNKKYNPVRNTIRPTIRQFISTPNINIKSFTAIGLNSEIHLALNRPHKYGFSSGSYVHLFEPRGMSGGMIFGLYAMSRPSVLAGLDMPLIIPAAIVTEKNTRHQLLFGTRIAIIVETIRRRAR